MYINNGIYELVLCSRVITDVYFYYYCVRDDETGVAHHSRWRRRRSSICAPPTNQQNRAGEPCTLYPPPTATGSRYNNNLITKGGRQNKRAKKEKKNLISATAVDGVHNIYIDMRTYCRKRRKEALATTFYVAYKSFIKTSPATRRFIFFSFSINRVGGL